MSGRVMEFDREGALRITYPERLIQLIKEVRMFGQMQVPVVNKKIREHTEQGLKFYRFAVQLKQICNFHNHLGSEILPCQKLMVLQSAVKFENLFANPEGNAQSQSGIQKMYWGSVEKLEDFTLRVQEGANQLRTLNRQLRIAHQQVCDLVLQLGGISLLRQRDMWKQKITAIIKTINTTSEEEGEE
jgi:dynein heavy chain 2, cytosolic